MRHRPKVINVVAAFSSLLFVLTLLLWARSLYVGDILRSFGNPMAFVRSEDGLLAFHWSPSDSGEKSGWRHERWSRGDGDSAWRWLGGGWGRLGFLYAVGGASNGTPAHQLVVPYYAISLLAAFAPALWIVRRLRVRAHPGRCVKCGYDLRASPDRCPECGTRYGLPDVP